MMENPEIHSPVDRISSLPDEILHHILSFIPNTEERATTSVISKRFQHLWTHQTSVRLGYTDRYNFLNPDSPDSAPAIDRYVLSVDRCLSSFSSPLLRSLSLKLIPGSRALARSAFRWVRFAAGRSVAEICLGSISGRDIRIPQSIFACRALVSLELHACTFRSIPANFPGFPLLSRLKISGSTISDKTLASLLSLCPSLCPSLCSLVLSLCRDLRNLELSSPNLTEFDIFYCPALVSLRIDAPNLSIISFTGNVANLFLKDARCLVNANIWHQDDINDAGPDITNITNLLELARPIVELRHVSRRLRVTDWFFKVSLPESPTPLFPNLKKLHCCTQWVTAPLLRRLVPMLAQCPNLELLYIDLSRGVRSSVEIFKQQQLLWFSMKQEELGHCPDYMKDYEKQCEDDKVGEVWDSSSLMDDFGDVIPRLKTIKINAFLGTANEMNMLEYLLHGGKALENLIIGDCLMHGEEEIHRLLDDICRSSIHVQIREKKE